MVFGMNAKAIIKCVHNNYVSYIFHRILYFRNEDNKKSLKKLTRVFKDILSCLLICPLPSV